MKKINPTKIKLYVKIHLGLLSHKIDEIPDSYYNRLRYIYHNYIPASFYLLMKNIPDNSEELKCVLFTTILQQRDDYDIVIAKSISGPRVYIELNDKVVDLELLKIMDKDFYENLLGIQKVEIIPKERVQEIIRRGKIGYDDIHDCQNISWDLLEGFELQQKNCINHRKKLISRQVSSFFKDLQYENQVMYIDVDQYKKNK